MLATKFASSSSAHTPHVPRARVSHRREIRSEDVREDKGCNGVPGGNLIVALLVSATGESLRQREGLNDPGVGFCHPQPYHSIAYTRLGSITASVTNCWTSTSLRGDLIFFARALR